ncbi:MAG TPA: response regulator [Crenotrichaceae bacterium]|nr:response regulator [Crenotrichaceae bacterium]
MQTNPDSPAIANLLLVEDDVRLAALTQDYLQQQGFHVVVIHHGNDAVNAVKQITPDVLILDIMLPGMDGLEICRQIRPWFSNPVLMLTARDEDLDEIIGLELGADDYVTKPVQPRVLLARINALLRRRQLQRVIASSDKTILKQIRIGQLQINQATRDVYLNQQSIILTTNEFELLWLLAQHPGEILSRDQILSSLRGIDYDGLDRWVDIRISHLRHKLGDDPQQPFRIKTIWGKGYLFVQDAWG